MVNMKVRTEVDLFRFLYKFLHRDLVAMGFPPSIAGSLLKWFDPGIEAYLAHVSAWQESLCRGYAYTCDPLPESVGYYLGILKNGYWSITDLDPWMCKIIHRIAKMFYKFRGQARKRTDMDEVFFRLSNPGHVQLSPNEVERMRQTLSVLTPPSSWERLCGRYGPGTTADGLDNFGKWIRKGSFPARVPITTFISSIDDYCSLPRIRYSKFGITKIAEVPKSLKSTRVVSSEPAQFMFAQLAVGDSLVRELHRNYPNRVSLYDAERHNRLLYHADACSIDLSDASDHVSRSLVARLMPHWWSYLSSVRSTFARFPDGRICPLRTFAPMGSGVCFPVLTAVCLAALAAVCKRPFHVYGDDIIVLRTDYDRAIDILTRCGLVVNTSKSCSNLVYRESCGLELFYNLDITPIYIREDWRKSYSSKLELVVSELSDPVTPFTNTRDAILSEIPKYSLRWNKSLQRLEIGVQAERPIHLATLPSQAGLFRWYCVKSQLAQVYSSRSRTISRLSFESCENYPALTKLHTAEQLYKPFRYATALKPVAPK